ncbi:MAG: histidine phosphatase family protein [Luteolibacter sp.]
MELLLLRHGKAEDFASSGGGDFARALEEKGMQQSRNAARVLGSADFLPDLVLSSPVLRAKQTAAEFCRAAGIPDPLIEGWLACGMSPQTALSELSAYSDTGRVMIVGHEPDFSHLVQHALGANGGSIHIGKGSLTCLEIRPPSPRATLLFSFPQKFAKHME